MRAQIDGPERALADARAAAVEVGQARTLMLEAARRRQRALLAAHRAGLSIRAIAAELGCSPSVVQGAIRTARAAERSR